MSQLPNPSRKPWSWKEIPPVAKDVLEPLAHGFERSFFEAAVASPLGAAGEGSGQVDVASVELLALLAELYARDGLVEKSLEIDQRLVAARPSEPTFHYNLACSYSRLGRIDPALQALTDAVRLGYDKIEHLLSDPDLENLKKDSRYQALLRKLHGGVGGRGSRGPVKPPEAHGEPA